MHLIIQGADIETRALKQLAKLAGASGIERIKAEVAAVTAQAIRGEIEYDESLRRGVAVLKLVQ